MTFCSVRLFVPPYYFSTPILAVPGLGGAGVPELTVENQLFGTQQLVFCCVLPDHLCNNSFLSSSLPSGSLQEAPITQQCFADSVIQLLGVKSAFGLPGCSCTIQRSFSFLPRHPLLLKSCECISAGPVEFQSAAHGYLHL